MSETKSGDINKSEWFDCPNCGKVRNLQLFAQVAGAVWAEADPKEVFPRNMTHVCFVVICSQCSTPLARGNPKIEKYVTEFIEWAEHGLGHHSDPEYLPLRAANWRREFAEEHKEQVD